MVAGCDAGSVEWPVEPAPPLGQLAQAVEADLWFTTGGTSYSTTRWVPTTSPSYYGGDSATTYLVEHNGEAWFQTTVSAPAAETLSFYWKVSSEANHDYLEFYLDGVLQSGRISGTGGDWEQKSYTLSAGSHTLKWRYVKDGSGSAGSDRGWVDWVRWLGQYRETFSSVGTPVTR